MDSFTRLIKEIERIKAEQESRLAKLDEPKEMPEHLMKLAYVSQIQMLDVILAIGESIRQEEN